MDETPKRTWRRWFQFRLSTWLVLVAILCWGMAEWPFYYFQLERLVKPGFVKNCAGICEDFVHYETIPLRRVSAIWIGDDDDELEPLTAWLKDSSLPAGTEYSVSGPSINQQVIWPLLALVALIGWKVAWLIVKRGRATGAIRG